MMIVKGIVEHVGKDNTADIILVEMGEIKLSNVPIYQGSKFKGQFVLVVAFNHCFDDAYIL